MKTYVIKNEKNLESTEDSGKQVKVIIKIKLELAWNIRFISLYKPHRYKKKKWVIEIYHQLFLWNQVP
jgi:hypothetical protein